MKTLNIEKKLKDCTLEFLVTFIFLFVVLQFTDNSFVIGIYGLVVIAAYLKLIAFMIISKVELAFNQVLRFIERLSTNKYGKHIMKIYDGVLIGVIILLIQKLF